MKDPGEKALWVGPTLRPPVEEVEAAGFTLCGHAWDAREGLRMIRDLRPGLVLAEAVLPGLEGESFVREVTKLVLYEYPTVLLTRIPGTVLLEPEMLPRLGAAVIGQPPSAAEIAGAVKALRTGGPVLPPEKAERLERLLDAIGVPEHPGRACLREAVTLVWANRFRLRDMSAALYPETGARCGLTGEQVGRAIRHVIEEAFRHGDIERQQRIFGNTIDARRGYATPKETIATLADILRWEG